MVVPMLVSPGGATGKRAQRIAQILDAVTASGELTLADLTDAFTASPATLRRDLALLADQGLVVRTHGGVRAMRKESEVPVALRHTKNQDAKQRIAAAAAARIPTDRHAVAISGGTTTAATAVALSNHTDLTIVTNSLTIASLASPYPGLKVVVTGGILRPQSLELVGVLAEGTFTAVNVGTAILGADGVSAAAGFTTYDETEARTNRAMVTKATHTIVVADGSKIGRAALAQISPAEDIDVLVTDATADPVELHRLRDCGVDVVVVDVDDPRR